MKCCAHIEEIINVIVCPNKQIHHYLWKHIKKKKKKGKETFSMSAAPARQKHQFLSLEKKLIWTLLVITKQPFLMQSAKLLDWVTEAGSICHDWLTPTDPVSTLMSAPFFTASPTAALKYTARKRFASCSFPEIDNADYPAHERDVTDRHFHQSLIS